MHSAGKDGERKSFIFCSEIYLCKRANVTPEAIAFIKALFEVIKPNLRLPFDVES
jgi:hypothetical protein